MPNTARILIVEDEYLVAKHLRLALEDDGYEVAGVAASSGQALFVAERERPDLVLMDVHIRGDVDGVATASILREELGVPVVFLTANADDPTFQRALQVGAGGFLTKPFNAQRVHHAIQVALGQRESERRIKIENLQLRRESTVDALTGLFNRRHLEDLLDREIEFAGRSQHPLSVVMLDLDHFKAINDHYGHSAGDAVLAGVAGVLRAASEATTRPVATAATSCSSWCQVQARPRPRFSPNRCASKSRSRALTTGCASSPP